VLEEAIEAKYEMAELAMEQTVEAADLPPGDVWISEESHTPSGSRNDADQSLELWHSRMGHVSAASLHATAKATTGIPTDLRPSDKLICVPCDL
jgi:hypothetical protein